MIDIARDEERWLSISHEIKLRNQLRELKERRSFLRYLPDTRANELARKVTEELIEEVADEYWLVINYNRAKGWIR